MHKKATIILVSAMPTAVALFALGHAERVTHHVDDRSWLWGTRQGMSDLNVRTYLGVDLAKLVPASIRVDDQHVVVYLPEPEVLDVVPDLASWKYVSKASGLQHLRDAVRGRSVRDELMALVQEALPRYRNCTL